MTETIRTPLKVAPYLRMSEHQINLIHSGSMQILNDPGLVCFNEHAADLYEQAGCRVKRRMRGNAGCLECAHPGSCVIQKHLESVPRRIILGARNPENKLELDAEKPHVYFGTGSETNIVLHSQLKEYTAKDDASQTRVLAEFQSERGSLQNLCRSAKSGGN
ncbi:MAG: trimethylamine methyltransferase family protein [candidate division KSB1 bacterium]|nr:trimethylamine methyltransferase family protein [candidate division KSB1 bacterium]